MELCSGKILGSSSSTPDIKVEELILPSLPKELLERILVRVPFPQIFKMRMLSKSWNGKLSSISSQDNDEKKLLAASFQRLVCQQSDEWRIYTPIHIYKEFFIIYEGESEGWRKTPFLCSLPEEVATKVRSCFCNHALFRPSMAGALLSITTALEDSMYVINIFTGSWRELPALPHVANGRSGTEKRLVSSNETYKVIRLYSDVGYLCAWIYDAKFRSWSRKRVVVEVDLEVGYFDAYLNGRLYVLLHVDQRIWGFLAFHVRDETFQLLPMPLTAVLSQDDLHKSYIVACNGTLYVILRKDLRTLIMGEADLVKLRWSKEIYSRVFSFSWIHDFNPFKEKPSSDGESIFFKERATGIILICNLREKMWSYFPKVENLEFLGEPLNFQVSFEPGMNLFLEV